MRQCHTPKQILVLRKKGGKKVPQSITHYRAARKSAKVIIQVNAYTKALFPLPQSLLPLSQEPSLFLPFVKVREVMIGTLKLQAAATNKNKIKL